VTGEERFHELMCLLAEVTSESEDDSTQCGAFLYDPKEDRVSCMANNEVLPNLGHFDLSKRDQKLAATEHAERNCIYLAAKKGIQTQGKVLFASWVACEDCARAIVCSGIKQVVTFSTTYENTPKRWRESVDRGLDILNRHIEVYSNVHSVSTESKQYSILFDRKKLVL